MKEEFTNEQVELDVIPSLDQIHFEPISKNYLWVLYLSSILRYAIVFFVYFIVANSMRDEIPLDYRKIAPLIILVWFVFGLFRIFKIHQKKSYALRTHDINYKRGWFWKKKTTIPYYRIQHTELSSGPIERIFDLSTLHIYTAGGSNSDLSVPGLLTVQGEQMKKYILEKMGEDEEE